MQAIPGPCRRLHVLIAQTAPDQPWLPSLLACADAPPADPTSVVGLPVSKQFFAPGSKGKKKRPVQRFSGVVVEHNIFDGVDK